MRETISFPRQTSSTRCSFAAAESAGSTVCSHPGVPGHGEMGRSAPRPASAAPGLTSSVVRSPSAKEPDVFVTS